MLSIKLRIYLAYFECLNFMNIKSIKLYRVTFFNQTIHAVLYVVRYDKRNDARCTIRYTERCTIRYDTQNDTIYHSRRMTVSFKRISYRKWYSVSFMVYRASCVYRACSVRISFV